MRKNELSAAVTASQAQHVVSSALLGVEACGLHRRTPYGMTNVSMTQLSIARHYGGCRFQGEDYIYLPTTDELIRHDVLRWQRKQKRAAKTPNTGNKPRETSA